jgi:mannose-6-phosphate isomerase-like protein (cupin superfamily)
MTKANERETVRVDHANGGAGFLLKEGLLTNEQLGANCRMFSRVTLKPGCELGFHEHHGEIEAYYILTGHGIYLDDQKEVFVEAGDVTYCDDGHGHGLKNTGDEDLAFVALILKK